MQTTKKKHKGLKITGIVLLAVTVLCGVCALLPRPKAIGNNPLLIQKGGRPLLIAHGGGNMEFPDNTLEAFYNAYSIDPGCMMETDVSMTKDGVIILSHDTTLDRKTNVSGAIIDWTYADLVAQEVNFNYENAVEPESNGTKVNDSLTLYSNHEGKNVWPYLVQYPTGVAPRHAEKFLVTTLEELIKAFPNNTINVEIKQSGETGRIALRAVLKLMEELDAEYNTFARIVLASFHKEIYDDLRAEAKQRGNVHFSPQAKGVATLYFTHFVGLDVFDAEPATVLQIPMTQSGLNLSFPSFIQAAHRHNIAVHYWTINDTDDMLKLIRAGADGIMTDLPTLLKEVLALEFGEQN